MDIHDRSSPNHGPRRGGALPDLVVIHYTAMETAEAALQRLCDSAAEVSAHYVIGAGGQVWRLVAESERAWHAGAGQWGEIRDVNSRSIGIELANAGPLDLFPPFPEAQMAALEALLDAIMARWSIDPAGVIAHADVAPGRKTDPGNKFDWRRLALGGRSIWPWSSAPATADWAVFEAAASRIGYAPPAGAWAPVLDAFRLRFRPGASGDLAAEDVSLACSVAMEHARIDRDADGA